MTVVLMYHALFKDNAGGADHAGIDAEDWPYALDCSEFQRQLDELTALRVGLFDQSDALPHIVITFDDGHASNLHMAAPLLQERGLSACFFITTGYIDRREGFLTSDELVELSEIPGMCIGSHGVTHRFFNELSESAMLAELEQSRDALERLTGKGCTSISFPGGRYNKKTLTLARSTGFCQLYGSDFGVVKPSAFASQAAAPAGSQRRLLEQCDSLPLARVPVKQGVRHDDFRRIIFQDSAYFRRQRLHGSMKKIARDLLGNRLYHGLYKHVARR
ncbi:MAG: polysaccharide deacetylase family protein [Granulosicoccus sp.]